MKHLRQLCAAAVLTVTIAQGALADGIIHPGKDVPPPPPPPSTLTTTAEATAETADSGEATGGTLDATTEVAPNLLQSVLAFF